MEAGLQKGRESGGRRRRISLGSQWKKRHSKHIAQHEERRTDTEVHGSLVSTLCRMPKAKLEVGEMRNVLEK